MTRRHERKSVRKPDARVEQALSNLKPLYKQDLSLPKAKPRHPSTFPRFLELPDELQIAIWKAVVPVAQLINIELRWTEISLTGALDGYTWSFIKGMTIVPDQKPINGLAVACRKSRKVLRNRNSQLMSSDILRFMTTSSEMVIMDFAREILFLCSREAAHWFQQPTFSDQIHKAYNDIDPTLKIKSIAIEWRSWNPPKNTSSSQRGDNTEEPSASRMGTNRGIAELLFSMQSWRANLPDLEEILVIVPTGAKEAKEIKLLYSNLWELFGPQLNGDEKELIFVDLTWRQLRERAPSL